MSQIPPHAGTLARGRQAEADRLAADLRSVRIRLREGGITIDAMKASLDRDTGTTWLRTAILTYLGRLAREDLAHERDGAWYPGPAAVPSSSTGRAAELQLSADAGSNPARDHTRTSGTAPPSPAVFEVATGAPCSPSGPTGAGAPAEVSPAGPGPAGTAGEEPARGPRGSGVGAAATQVGAPEPDAEAVDDECPSSPSDPPGGGDALATPEDGGGSAVLPSGTPTIEEAPMSVMQQVLDYVREHPGCARAAVVRAVGQRHAHAVDVALNEHSKRGRLDRQAGGMGYIYRLPGSVLRTSPDPSSAPPVSVAVSPATGDGIAIEKAVEAEQARWQHRIYQRCCDAVEALGMDRGLIDGGGCDSGDPLDVTDSEVAQCIGWHLARIEERDREIASQFDQLARIADIQAHTERAYAERDQLRVDLDASNEAMRQLADSSNVLRDRVAELEAERDALADRVAASGVGLGQYLELVEKISGFAGRKIGAVGPAHVETLLDLAHLESHRASAQQWRQEADELRKERDRLRADLEAECACSTRYGTTIADQARYLNDIRIALGCDAGADVVPIVRDLLATATLAARVAPTVIDEPFECPEDHLDVLVEVVHTPTGDDLDAVSTYTLDEADDADRDAVVVYVRIPRRRPARGRVLDIRR